MSATTEAPKPPTSNTAAAPAATPAKPTTEKKTITLTFEGGDLVLHDKIVAQADDEDRTPSIELLRFVRKHFGAAKPAGS